MHSHECHLVRPPRTIVGKALCFTTVLFFSTRYLPRSMGRSLQNFATWSEACSIYKCLSKNLGVCFQKNLGGKKHAEFGPILDSFPL